MKKQELKNKFRKLYWLLGRNSELSVRNFLLIKIEGKLKSILI